MFAATRPLILASTSPRRHRFLRDLGIEFIPVAADIDETPCAGEQPRDFAGRMAREKATAVAAQHPQSCVLAADTVVAVDERILGKPVDADHALKMLRSLRGRTHQVITGVALICKEEEWREELTRTTLVSFTSFSDDVLKAYIRTREPMDKAGAYGIQGKGAFLVQEIQGSCSNVIGLPINDCISLLLNRRLITAVV